MTPGEDMITLAIQPTTGALNDRIESRELESPRQGCEEVSCPANHSVQNTSCQPYGLF